MNIDTVSLSAKIAGALIAGVAGTIGLFVNFKKADGSVDTRGWLILMGIVLATLANISIPVFDEKKDERKDEEQAIQTASLLKALDRSIHPITKLQSYYKIEMPNNNLKVRSYTDLIRKYVANNIEELRHFDIARKNPEAHVIASDSNGEPIDLEIDVKSGLWPKNDYAVIADVAISMTLTVVVSQPPFPKDNIPTVGSADLFATSIISANLPTFQWD